MTCLAVATFVVSLPPLATRRRDGWLVEAACLLVAAVAGILLVAGAEGGLAATGGILVAVVAAALVAVITRSASSVATVVLAGVALGAVTVVSVVVFAAGVNIVAFACSRRERTLLSSGLLPVVLLWSQTIGFTVEHTGLFQRLVVGAVG